MPSYLDLGLLAVVLVSALLATVRGFTREVMAIFSWGAAAAAAVYFYPLLVPKLADPASPVFIAKEALRPYAAGAAIFFIALIIVSFITIRISDAILNSKIGALDRSLGFLFGAVPRPAAVRHRLHLLQLAGARRRQSFRQLRRRAPQPVAGQFPQPAAAEGDQRPVARAPARRSRRPAGEVQEAQAARRQRRHAAAGKRFRAESGAAHGLAAGASRAPEQDGRRAFRPRRQEKTRQSPQDDALISSPRDAAVEMCTNTFHLSYRGLLSFLSLTGRVAAPLARGRFRAKLEP